MDFSKLEKTLDYTFRDKNLLRESLTHRSYLNENPAWDVPQNERLEFLGDAALELVVTEELFHRYPDYQEGALTGLSAALVNYQILASIARDMGLESFVLLSRGEAKDTGRAREVILANAIEAVIGALYLDGGYAVIKTIVNRFVMEHLEEVVRKGLFKDSKSALQERAQADLRITPMYRVLKEEGPDHDKIFTIGVFFDDLFIAEGKGPSKQDAELMAARAALRVKKWC